MPKINWIAVVVSVIVLQALGFLWYGPLLGGAWTEAWVEAFGKQPDTSNITLNMSLGVLNTIILVYGLAWVFGRLGVSTLAGIGAAAAIWFFFNFTTMAIDYLYINLPARLVIINMGYQLVSYLVTGAILGLLPPKAPAPAA